MNSVITVASQIRNSVVTNRVLNAWVGHTVIRNVSAVHGKPNINKSAVRNVERKSGQ